MSITDPLRTKRFESISPLDMIATELMIRYEDESDIREAIQCNTYRWNSLSRGEVDFSTTEIELLAKHFEQSPRIWMRMQNEWLGYEARRHLGELSAGQYLIHDNSVKYLVQHWNVAVYLDAFLTEIQNYTQDLPSIKYSFKKIQENEYWLCLSPADIDSDLDNTDISTVIANTLVAISAGKTKVFAAGRGAESPFEILVC